MSLVSRIHAIVEDTFAWVSLMLKQNILSYCSLEAADDKHVLVTKQGEILSIIQLEGYKRFIGPDEFNFLTERITEVLQPSLSSEGHSYQFYFSYDQSEISSHVELALEQAKEAVKRLELDIDDIFSSRVETLSSICSVDKTFIAVWTSSSVLTATQQKSLRKAQAEQIAQAKMPKADGMQHLMLVLPEIRNIHDSTVSSILEDLTQTGFDIKLLEVHKAVYHVRDSVAHTETAPDWRPHLPGDTQRLPFRCQPDGNVDVSEIFWPPLDSQIISVDGENIGLKTCRIGELIYAPIYIELFPKDIKPFYRFFDRMLGAHMPWRMSYHISPNGFKITQSKQLIAKVLSVTSHHNRLITSSHELLKKIEEQSDNPVVAVTVILTTWCPSHQPQLIKERAAKLLQVIQGWGGAEPREFSGDAMGTTFSSTLAMTNRPVATAAAAPLSDVVYMLPFVRPASPWSQGAVLFRTPDGKLWPFQPGSSNQVSWIDIIYARSGSGKSVLINTLNLVLCLSPGLTRLPLVAMIDIGPSSKGFISLLQEALPENKRHQVLYHRLRLEEADAINPFDTEVGARVPIRSHRSFLINFLSVLLVDRVEDRPAEGSSSMLSMIVDRVYFQFSDSEQPKVFVAQLEPEINKRIQELGFEATEYTTWWEVTDFLFENDERVLSLKAQRQAVPTIADTITAAHHHSIKDLFGEVQTQGSEDYIRHYSRVISGVIRNFPTLTSVTRLNIEGARVVSLDLDEVAKTGSDAADKQTAMMYMLSRHLLARHFFLSPQEVDSFPELYHQHHIRRVKEIMEEPKRLVLDEFHRTSRSRSVRDQVIQDMREGRKWNIHVSLASQSLDDFDSLMIEFATSIFILDSGPQVTIDKTCKTFGLTETEKLALKTRVHGPSSQGATFIAQFVTKKGLNTQLLTSTISAVELWAFTTTTEGVSIRDSLYKAVGPKPARQLLASRFPNGSASSEISTELKLNPTMTISEVVDQIVQSLVGLYRKRERQSKLKRMMQ